jgi:hypothetical protein
MIRKYFCLAITLWSLVMLPARASDIIDRIVATVDGHAILQSDWEEAIRYEAFIDGRQLDKLTADDRKATLDRLIDQELLREQVRSSASQVKNTELEQRIQEIRKLYPGAETEQGWSVRLERYGLNEKELKNRVAQQLNLMQMVEARLRPGIQVDFRSIELYYQESIVPQLRNSGAKQVALAEVSTKIKELLTQQKMNDLLGSWLQTLRAASQIRTPATSPTLPGAQTQ